MRSSVPTILLIDDDPMVIRAWRTVLERARFHVEISWQDRFQLVCGADRVDLILMDVKMPQVDGVSLSQALQKHWPEKAPWRPPIYLFSSLPEDDLEPLARKAKAAGYICKLWPVERVVQTVRQVIEARAKSA